VDLVRNGGKYGSADVTWQIVTSSLSRGGGGSNGFQQTEGVTTFHDLDTTAHIYIQVIIVAGVQG